MAGEILATRVESRPRVSPCTADPFPFASVCRPSRRCCSSIAPQRLRRRLQQRSESCPMARDQSANGAEHGVLGVVDWGFVHEGAFKMVQFGAKKPPQG